MAYHLLLKYVVAYFKCRIVVSSVVLIPQKAGLQQIHSASGTDENNVVSPAFAGQLLSFA
jgi:hypothetical protein